MRFSYPLVLTCLFVTACGGRAVVDSERDDAAASGGAAGSGGIGVAGAPVDAGALPPDATAGSAGEASGGAGGMPMEAGPVECTPSTGGSGGFQEPTCEDLSGLIVTNPTVVDDGQDGSVSAGEGATIRVVLRETSGEDFMYYPGVRFEANHPDVAVGNPGGDWLYGIFACGEMELGTHATFAASIPAGTVVTVTARVAMLSHDCTGTSAVAIPIVVAQ